MNQPNKPGFSIGTPTIVVRDERAEWSVEVKGPGLPEALWYSVPVEYTHMLSDRADAALLALLLPAMNLDLPLTIDGPLTDELAFAVPCIQALYAAQGLGRQQPMTALNTVPPHARAAGVATGYSGGIDSFSVLAAHHFADGIPESLRVSLLLFNDVGAHGSGESARRRGQGRLNAVRESVSHVGLPIIDVDSNVDSFYDPPLWFDRTHTPRNASVAYLLSEGIGTWLYASAYDYRNIGVRPGTAGLVDPIALPLFSTSMLTTRDSGTAHRRVDKTAIVADIPVSWEFLDVCVNGELPGNQQCSDCFKCRRTLLTLDILGVTDRYRALFDLEHWAVVRDEYLWDVIAARSDPMMLELREFMREHGYRVPVRIARYSYRPAASWLRAGTGWVTQAVGYRYRRYIRPRLARGTARPKS